MVNLSVFWMYMEYLEIHWIKSIVYKNLVPLLCYLMIMYSLVFFFYCFDFIVALDVSRVHFRLCLLERQLG